MRISPKDSLQLIRNKHKNLLVSIKGTSAPTPVYQLDTAPADTIYERSEPSKTQIAVSVVKRAKPLNTFSAPAVHNEGPKYLAALFEAGRYLERIPQESGRLYQADRTRLGDSQCYNLGLLPINGRWLKVQSPRKVFRWCSRH